jgi:hypothetical protein
VAINTLHNITHFIHVYVIILPLRAPAQINAAHVAVPLFSKRYQNRIKRVTIDALV